MPWILLVCCNMLKSVAVRCSCLLLEIAPKTKFSHYRPCNWPSLRMVTFLFLSDVYRNYQAVFASRVLQCVALRCSHSLLRISTKKMQVRLRRRRLWGWYLNVFYLSVRHFWAKSRLGMNRTRMQRIFSLHAICACRSHRSSNNSISISSLWISRCRYRARYKSSNVIFCHSIYPIK